MFLDVEPQILVTGRRVSNDLRYLSSEWWYNAARTPFPSSSGKPLLEVLFELGLSHSAFCMRRLRRPSLIYLRIGSLLGGPHRVLSTCGS